MIKQLQEYNYFKRKWRVISAVNIQFKQLEGRKKPEKYQGFNGIRTRDLRDLCDLPIA